MLSMDPLAVRALVNLARSSPENARLAKVNVGHFVQLALRGLPLHVTNGVRQAVAGGWLDGVDLGSLWLQPTQDP
jgi:hypothetical protein